MKKFLSLCSKFLGALIVGCIVALGLVQNDPWLKKRIERQVISSISATIGEVFEGSVTDLDLLGGKLIMSNVKASSSKGEWSFYAPRIHLDISFLSWIKNKKFDAELIIEQPIIKTAYQKGEFALSKPIEALVSAPVTLPIAIKYYRCENGQVSIRAPYGHMLTRASSVTAVEPLKSVTTIRCTEAKAFHKESLFAHHGAGSVILEIPVKSASQTITIKVNCTRPIGRSLLQDVPYHLYYRSANNKGICRWRAEDGSLTVQVDDITSTPQELMGSISLTGHLGEIASYGSLGQTVTLTGIGSFDGLLKINEQECGYSGNASINSACCSGVTIDAAAMKLEGTEKYVAAHIDHANSMGMDLKGTLSASLEQQDVKADLILAQPYTGLPKCTVSQGKAQIGFKNNLFTADIAGMSSFFEGVPVPLKGKIKSDFKTAQVKGTAGSHFVDAEFMVNPVTIKKVRIKDSSKNSRLHLGQHQSGIKGTIEGTFVKTILEALTGHQLSGSLNAEIMSKNTAKGTQITIKANEASLKIPGTYTVIQEISGIIDIASTDRLVILKDFLVTFHKGAAWSAYATFSFNQDGSLVSAHVPIQLREVLISKHKDMFGTLSGGITATFTNGRWLCEGMITLENAHVRSNLFSSNVQKELLGGSSGSPFLGWPVDLNLNVQSRAPLKINTLFLTADTYLDLHIGGELNRPLLKGSLDVPNGKLSFPYKPLLVTSGKLTITPEQADGPTIDLIAKNKIRAYTVTLKVTGTLSQPSIVFESSPSLSEERIMTLLLAGTDQGSLTAAMPRMVMQQIENLLFGSEDSLSKAQQVLRTILTPFKSVRLVKKEDTEDELQAVVEVDINDRLRAKAQNNLQLSDETQLELEYAVSDDVTVKAVRDKSGSLGGEVEMRWKF